MTDVCRRCPLLGSAGPYGPPRTSVYGDAVEPGRFRVVVAAGSSAAAALGDASDALGAALDWRDALVALATAVVERGGVIAVPANAELVHVVALAAYPHARSHAAEAISASATAPVHVYETGGASEASRRLISPLVHRNVVAYLHANGEPVAAEEFPLPAEDDGRYAHDEPHHPILWQMTQGALGVVIVHPDASMAGELREVQAGDWPNLTVFGGAGLGGDLDHWAARHDPTRALLRQLLGDLPVDLGPTPYGVVMESLVDFWLQEGMFDRTRQ